MSGCDKYCWECRYYICFSDYCNYRYETYKSRGCPAGEGCIRRILVRQKRESRGTPAEPFIPRRPPTDNEMEIIRLCAEANRRGLSYGMLVWSLDAAELRKIARGEKES